MWKHKILEGFESGEIFGKYNTNGNKKYTDHVQSSVENSHVFYIEDMVATRNATKNLVLNGSEIDFSKYEMPYKNTLLCYNVHGLKSASLYFEHPFDGKSLMAQFYDASTLLSKNKPVWFLLPDFLEIQKDGSSRLITLDKEIRENGYSSDANIEMRHCASRLYVLSLLLNCKNISTETIFPSEKLNRKRQKNNKLPLYEHKVLKVNLGGKNKGKSKSIDPLNHNRLHFCRGHFKEYTDKNPLFGRCTGLYWWQPHLRGEKTLGFVDKEYKIITETGKNNV